MYPTVHVTQGDELVARGPALLHGVLDSGHTATVTVEIINAQQNDSSAWRLTLRSPADTDNHKTFTPPLLFNRGIYVNQVTQDRPIVILWSRPPEDDT